MRAALITITILLTACYGKSDAVDLLKEKGRPMPITCVTLSGDSRGGHQSFACTDGAGLSWACDKEGCIRWSGNRTPAEGN